MAPKWLYEIDGGGLFVTTEFMDRIRRGDTGAQQALTRLDLTPLYRHSYSRRTKWETAGLFWDGTPAIECIPIARGGRHSPRAWMRAYLSESDWTRDESRIKRHVKNATAERKQLKQQQISRQRKPPTGAANLFRYLHEQALIEQWESKSPIPPLPDETLHYEIKPTPERTVNLGPRKARYEPSGWSFKAYRMKVNPKFELVVVNKHDRAALLKLLTEIDTSPTVEVWLHERTERGSATLSSALFADYNDWCREKGEVALGKKAFAQALVANRVLKLTRSKEGVRYELVLRPISSNAAGNRG